MKHFSGISPALIFLLLLLAAAVYTLEWVRTPEHPVLAEPPRSTDMAVIGGTTAALLTAYYAAQNGAQVYLFPQSQELGEDASFILSGGLAATLTPPQRELEEAFIPGELEDMLRERGGEMNNPALLAAFVRFSNRLYPLFEELSQADFSYLPDPLEKPYLHMSPEFVDPVLFVQELKLRVLQAGVIISNDAVKKISFCPEGKISGLLLERSSGESELLNLRSVVLADGGYSGYPYSWHPYLPKDNMLVLRPGQQGLGLRLAADLGMDVVQTGFYRRRILLFAPYDENYHLLEAQPMENAYFFNNRGEMLKWAEADKQMIISFIQMSPPEKVFLLLEDSEGENIDPAWAPFFRRFPDWDSLASFCGGEIPEFPLPFLPGEEHLVAALRVGIDYTLGGLAVSPQGEVKQGGEMVPGLYAAGEIWGGLHGEAMLPGMALSETLFSAVVTGEAAALNAWRE